MNKDIKALSIELKTDIMTLMDNMLAFKAKYPKFELPQPSEEFTITKELLTKGEFILAVCGKVKNGKSSLINALIGKDLLPVCNDVATSRVFKITASKEEKFYLIYANGNRKEINHKDLELYGSQAIIDQKGEKDITESIAYIQVYTPMNFLPEGVSLIDTPGIGSTYPQHTAITKQYIKMADAAMFVMNPTPLEKIEIEFLKEVVKVTPGIIFVTTKIDQNDNEGVEESIKRNNEIIESAIGDELQFGISMLKMSSKLLLDAATAEDEITSQFIYEISGYDEVKTSIINIVFMILGYYRAGMAYNTCIEYYKEVLNILELKLNTIKESSSNYENLLSEYEKSLADFNEKMGESRRKEVSNKIETILVTMQGDFNQIFSTEGNVRTKYDKEIENLKSEEIIVYGENLGERIIADLQSEWDQLTFLVQSKTSDELAKFNDDCIMSIPKGLISISKEGLQDPSIKNIQLRDRVGKMRNEMFLGNSISTALWLLAQGSSYFIPALVTPISTFVLPVIYIIGIGSVLWGAISGNKKAKQDALENNKKQLNKFVADAISNCRKQLTETSLSDNKYQSLYTGFLSAVREQANNTITSIYNRYNEELESMRKTILESKQNPQLLAAVEHLLKEWSKNKELIHLIHNKLETVKSL